MKALSLADALASDRLEDFVKQAETQGIGPISADQFDARLRSLTAPQPEDQTSRLPDHDCSREK